MVIQSTMQARAPRPMAWRASHGMGARLAAAPGRDTFAGAGRPAFPRICDAHPDHPISRSGCGRTPEIPVSASSARLRLLGAPVLLDADGTPVAGATAQPHRIALLALLALHPRRTATRADLTRYLWPGHDPKEASQLLNKELFSVNKALGDDAIFFTAKEVRLGSRVTVDALDFQAALEAGRPEDAVNLYTGPLLDGFELDDAPEFQGWAASQRARFAAARKTLRPVAEAAVEVQHDLSEPPPEVVRSEPPPEVVPEVAKPRADVRRKRPKRAQTPREVPAAQETPAEVAPPAPEPPAEVTPPAAATPSGVFWAPEPSPVVGHAAQGTTPQEPRTSGETPAKVVPAEPPPDFVIERSAPPVNFTAEESPAAASEREAAREAAAREAAARETAARETAARETEAREAAAREAAAREAAAREATAREAAEREAIRREALARETPGWPAEAARDVATPMEDVPAEAAEAESEVVFLEPPPPEPVAPPPAAEPVPARAPRRRRPLPRPPAKLVVTVLVLALLGGVGYVARGLIMDARDQARAIAGGIADVGARARSAAGRIVDARDRARSIAVLPIEFTGRDPVDQALAAGLGDELRRMLARSGLLVTPGDMFAYRGPPYDVRSIADTLGVPHVLHGTMRRDGDTVRFRFQLVNAADGVTRWAQDYAPSLSDILVLQDDVVETVARQILERPATRSVRETESAAAYQLVLRGSDAARGPSDSAARQGLEFFRQAVALDSSYARAWAGLARMYVRTLPTLPAADRDRQLTLANQAAQRAVALDDSLAESHAALGVARSAHFDMAGAQAHLQHALELDATRATHGSLVDLYLWTGAQDRALATAEQALARDSLSPYAHADVARVLQSMNRCEQAVARLDRAASATRALARAAQTRALCHAQAGRWSDAVAAVRSAITARDSSSVALLAFLLQRAGDSTGARPLRARVMDRQRRGRASALDLALLDAGERNLDAAARRIQEAVDTRSFVMAPGVDYVMLTGPLVPELHRHPGFLQVRRRLGYGSLTKSD